jgi:anion-transporting  ArsA/GET3 family ATPase
MRKESTAPTLDTLFQRRLLVVAGKGGVGKTTIACALGLIGAHLGKRTLLAEVDGAGRAARLLGVEPPAVGDTRETRPLLSVMAVDGSAALAEYLEIIVPVKRVLQAVFASRIYQYFVAAAPGLKELMTIGKIWYEAERTDEGSGERLWDLVILDAPATGHSLQYLRMPRAAHDAFGGGLVGRESQRLIDLLTDPKRTAVNLVTTAEEMPVNETVEMYHQVHDELDMPLGFLFVNRTHAAGFDAEDLEALQAGLAELRDRRERAVVEEIVNRGREELGWTTINRTYLQRLNTEVDMPLLEVPFVFAEEFGVEEVRAISTALAANMAGAARRTGHHGRT